MQLVDHESDDALAVFRDHADHSAPAEDEFLLAPGIFKSGVLDGEDFRHVATDHPTDMDADLTLGRWDRVHRASFHGTNGRRWDLPRTGDQGGR